MAEDCKMLASTPEGGANRGPDAAQPPMAEAPAPAWSRLIALPPHSEIGVIDLRPRIAALGKDVFKSTAQISADARISGEHCKISRSDEDHDVYMYDLSSNGTYVNGVLIGKDSRQLLKNGDTVTLLDPEKPNHYKFIFQDLRAPPPPAPPTPVEAADLLQNTSFRTGGISEDYGSAKHYDEVCELGRGAFAVVKKVVHRRTGQPFAMKVMEKKKLLGQLRRKSGVQVDEMKAKVLSEARILKNLSHPNIIKLHDIFENDRELCLVMELVDGGELFDYLVDNGPCSEPTARCIMRQLLQALQYLHSRNIVHRDLKPENILLKRSCSSHAEGSSSSPAPPTVKIADFGLAKLVGEKKVTSTFCGTPQYFAPEVLESRESHRGYDSACDLWSVGVIMYILLCGSPPFDEVCSLSLGVRRLPTLGSLSVARPPRRHGRRL